MRTRGEVLFKTIQSTTLLRYFEKHEKYYGGDYPRQLTSMSLFDALGYLFRKLDQDSLGVSRLVFHIIEPNNIEKNPDVAQYVIVVTRTAPGYSITLLYRGTGEIESISTVEPNRTVWSPDMLNNSKHIVRTKYYLGFIYWIAERAREMV